YRPDRRSCPRRPGPHREGKAMSGVITVPARYTSPTFCESGSGLGQRRNASLSATRKALDGRGGGIRTHDLVLPKHARCQATLRPVPPTIPDVLPIESDG